MFELLIVWVVFSFFSIGVLGFSFLFARKQATKPWGLAVAEDYTPKVSIIVPTYNESTLIQLKLENLSRIEYPRELIQAIMVDSNSSDETVEIAQSYARAHPEMRLQILREEERKGKSAALNAALAHCHGDIIVISDADCFWSSDILKRSIPYLHDPTVGAVSGQKILLNPDKSWVTRTESSYLNSMNVMKLGHSKLGSNLFFEGGFSAYKRETLDSFDPYKTGSDDCGTVIALAERASTTLFIPEAQFYTTFPETWKGRLDMKIRRANQLVRVFWRYLSMLVQGRIRFSRLVIVPTILNYLLGPLMFLGLMITTALLLFTFPYFALLLLFMIIPKVRSYSFDVIQNYIILLLSMVSVVANKKFTVWSQPEDRTLLNRSLLQQHDLL